MSERADETVAKLAARLEQLLAATGASRVTVRLDLPQLGFGVDDVAAEARQDGVASLKGQTAINQRAAATVQWLERERRLLVQNDLAGADPAPPQQLVEIYCARAQVLAPLEREGNLVGWISVHENRGPRHWSNEDQRALETAAAWFHDWLASF
jgi:maleate isomerase